MVTERPDNETLLSMKCPLSNEMKCPSRKCISIKCVIMKCIISVFEIPLSKKCPIYEMSHLPNIPSMKCHKTLYSCSCFKNSRSREFYKTGNVV